MSIDRAEFDKILAEVAEVFSPPDEGQVDIYYRHMARHLPGELRRAATRLIETHTYQRFPLIAEWNDAVSYVIQQTHQPDPDSLDAKHSCGFCAEGFVPYVDKDGYCVAGYCDCAKGRALYQRHADYMRRVGHPMKNVEFRRPDGRAEEPQDYDEQFLDEQAECDRAKDLSAIIGDMAREARAIQINEELNLKGNSENDE